MTMCTIYILYNKIIKYNLKTNEKLTKTKKKNRKNKIAKVNNKKNFIPRNENCK